MQIRSPAMIVAMRPTSAESIVRAPALQICSLPPLLAVFRRNAGGGQGSSRRGNRLLRVSNFHFELDAENGTHYISRTAKRCRPKHAASWRKYQGWRSLHLLSLGMGLRNFQILYSIGIGPWQWMWKRCSLLSQSRSQGVGDRWISRER